MDEALLFPAAARRYASRDARETQTQRWGLRELLLH